MPLHPLLMGFESWLPPWQSHVQHLCLCYVSSRMRNCEFIVVNGAWINLYRSRNMDPNNLDLQKLLSSSSHLFENQANRKKCHDV